MNTIYNSELKSCQTRHKEVLMKTISAREANRHFSNLLREVSSGEVITILSRGKPVATISPASIDRPQKNAARLRLLKRLEKQNVSGSRNWTRDELYVN